MNGVQGFQDFTSTPKNTTHPTLHQRSYGQAKQSAPCVVTTVIKTPRANTTFNCSNSKTMNCLSQMQPLQHCQSLWPKAPAPTTQLPFQIEEGREGLHRRPRPLHVTPGRCPTCPCEDTIQSPYQPWCWHGDLQHTTSATTMQRDHGQLHQPTAMFSCKKCPPCPGNPYELDNGLAIGTKMPALNQQPCPALRV